MDIEKYRDKVYETFLNKINYKGWRQGMIEPTELLDEYSELYNDDDIRPKEHSVNIVNNSIELTYISQGSENYQVMAKMIKDALSDIPREYPIKVKVCSRNLYPEGRTYKL